MTVTQSFQTKPLCHKKQAAKCLTVNRLALDLCCGDKKISPAYVGFDRRATKDADIVGDAENLSCFADNSFHTVYCSRALQHVPNDVQALKEIKRVLASDGIAVIEVSKFWNAIVSIVLNRLHIKKHQYATYHIYTGKRLKLKVAESGLRLVSLASVSTMTPLFRNYLLIVVKPLDGCQKERTI